MQHLRPVTGGWYVWRWICVRSAGFPIDAPLALAASPMFIAGLNALGELEASIDASRVRLRADVRTCREAATRDRRTPWTKALKQVEHDSLPASLPDEAPASLRHCLGDLQKLLERRAVMLSELERGLESECDAASRVLRRWSADARFREALLIQNPDALQNAADPLLAQPAGPGASKTRRREQLIANYLQRYSTKNDTISFFGPLGWADLGEPDARFAFACDGALLRRRELFLEHWMIDALADAYSDRIEIRRELPPRLWPTMRLEGDVLIAPIEQRATLPPVIAELLRLCDGRRTAADVATAACGIESLELADESEVFGILEELVDQKVLIWRLEIPTVGRRFEHELRRKLEVLSDNRSRADALAMLARVEAARSALEANRGSPERMGPAVADLRRVFTEQTGKSASRKRGEVFAARTVFYEDCVRNLDMTLGGDLAHLLAGPLSMLLQSGRWCTYQIARGYRELFERTHTELADASTSDDVSYLRFWEAVAPQFTNLNTPAPIVEAVGTELQARWRELLRVDPAAPRCDRSSAELRERALELFDAPHPGWPGARYQSPDVLIAAADVDALRRGDVTFVLGELHPTNSLCVPMFLHQHPTADELIRAREADIPIPCVTPVTSRHVTTRTDHNVTSAQNIDVELGDTVSWRPRDHVIGVGELIVARGDKGLEVCTRDRRHRFDIITFFEYQIIAAGLARVTILPSMPHAPRVTIDRLVVARETWRFDRDQLRHAFIEDRLARFRAIHDWRRHNALPRFVFFKASQEPKPTYVDFESPVYVDLFAHLARKAEHVTISEMLPSIESTWLPDAANRRYASELRMVFVDPLQYPS